MGPLSSCESVLNGAVLLEYRARNELALIAAKRMTLPLGNRLDVVGMVSVGDRMTGGQVSDELRQWAFVAGADYAVMQTKHEHMARSCARHGWQQTGVVMLMKVGHV